MTINNAIQALEDIFGEFDSDQLEQVEEILNLVYDDGMDDGFDRGSAAGYEDGYSDGVEDE